LRVSYQWLKEYVGVDLPPEELAERLTATGVAVERIEYPFQDLNGLLVGRILRVKEHPNADRLKVCEIEVGDRVLTVVSGAPNLAEGIYVPVAPTGTVLPGGQVVQEVDFRGVRSEGMVCSPAELGLGDAPEDRAGIMILPESVSTGQTLMEALDLDDAVLVLELTPNYAAHCQSMVGVAREVAALGGLTVHLPGVKLEEKPEPAADLIEIEVQAPDLCPRYTARVIDGVKVKPSPGWMQRRLRAAGIRPINNIVDVTNYVMIEYGQPLHAFDYERLRNRKILVRRARPGEKLVTLDGVERELGQDDLVIADAERAIGLAGIMGGENTEVTEETTTILLESAHFNRQAIARTSRRLGLRTEASIRFEKGVDPEGTVLAADRAAYLYQVLGVGQVLKGAVDIYPRPVLPARVKLRPDWVNEILGLQLSGDEIRQALARLGFEVQGAGRGEFTVIVPTWRADVEREVDLVEEVARMYGYDRIPTTLPVGPMGRRQRDQWSIFIERIRRVVVAAGLQEIVTYSFIDPSSYRRLRLDARTGAAEQSWVRLSNPLTEDQSVMRTTLLPSMLNTLAYNYSRGNEDLAFYEVGTVYLADEGGEDGLPREGVRLVVAAAGRTAPAHWLEKPARADFYYLKGIWEVLARDLGLHEVEFEPSDHAVFHPTRQAVIQVQGQQVGVLGEVHPGVVEDCNLPERTVVMEVDLDVLVGLADFGRKHRALPRFPATTRDLSVMVPEDVPAARITRAIQEGGGELLERVVLFDVYRGSPVPEGYRSLAFSMVYRAGDRTLTDEEVDQVHDRVRQKLENEFRVRLRS